MTKQTQLTTTTTTTTTHTYFSKWQIAAIAKGLIENSDSPLTVTTNQKSL